MKWAQASLLSVILFPFLYCIWFNYILLMKSHLQSYPCPLQINSFWNLGFLLGITIILQIITGIFLALHYTSDLNSAYSSVFFFIREIYYGWSLRYLHSSGASISVSSMFSQKSSELQAGQHLLVCGQQVLRQQPWNTFNDVRGKCAESPVIILSPLNRPGIAFSFLGFP